MIVIVIVIVVMIVIVIVALGQVIAVMGVAPRLLRERHDLAQRTL